MTHMNHIISVAQCSQCSADDERVRVGERTCVQRVSMMFIMCSNVTVDHRRVNKITRATVQWANAEAMKYLLTSL